MVVPGCGGVRLQQPVQKTRIDFPSLKIRVSQDPLEQREVGFYAAHKIFVQGARQMGDGLPPVASIANEFGQQRVIVDRHCPTFIDATIVPDAGPGRLL